MLKAIFWDNDGVLVDTERLYFAATQQVLAMVGVTLTRDMYVELLLVKGKGAWHLLEEKGVSPNAIKQLRYERNEIYSKLLCRENTIVDGVKEVLEALYGRYVMGIVTSSQKEHFEIIHRTSGLLKYFDFILSGNDYAKFKPNPEPYLLAVERSGCRKEECIAVEDSVRGLTSAKTAGLKCIIIPSELTQGGDFTKADRVLGSITEVLSEL